MIFSILMFTALTALVFAYEGVSFSTRLTLLPDIERVESEEEYESLKAGLQADKSKLIKFSEELAYDEKSDAYYSGHQDVKIGHTGKVWLKSFYDTDNRMYKITARSVDSYSELKIIVTGTPIIKIDSIKESRKALNTDYDKVILTAFEADPGAEPKKYQIRMSLRGDSSLLYPKKSYTLRQLGKEKMSLFGLPANEKYSLNSLYEDEYKMRDVFSWSIWTSGSAYRNERGIFNSSPMIYTEVFIDNSYEGLYGLQDLVNEHKLGFERKKGSIFEASTNTFPEAISPEGNLPIEGIELRYSNLEYKKRWEKFNFFFTKFTQSPIDQAFFDEKLDMTSHIEYYLFVELIMGSDNWWKNIKMSIDEESGKLMVTPWDLDLTFNANWSGKWPYYTETVFNEPWMIYYSAEQKSFIHTLVHRKD
ncbi:MAG TPA: CotH kinase family protein, partial [Oscillospiraceae bacterium]|nr:CotH kinase family protein [Oscillospiraceae bacterium]